MNIFLTGHRNIKDDDYSYYKAVMQAILKSISTDKTNLIFQTQLADGADQLMACIALEEGHKVNAVVPMGIKGFCAVDLGNVDEFKKIINNVNVKVTNLMPDDNEDVFDKGIRDKYYGKANDYCLNTSKLVIAIWDGKESLSDVGTAGTIKLALTKFNLPVCWIPIKTFDVSCALNIKERLNCSSSQTNLKYDSKYFYYLLTTS